MADKTSLRSLVSATADATGPASATYQVTTGVAGFSSFKAIAIVATITGGTGGALDVIVETSPNGGVDWYEYCHFTQVAAATAKTYIYSPALNGAMVNVGKNNLSGSTLTTTMTLAAGSGVGGPWGDLLRLRYVAGASTSVGAIQAVAVLCMSESGQA